MMQDQKPENDPDSFEEDMLDDDFLDEDFDDGLDDTFDDDLSDDFSEEGGDAYAAEPSGASDEETDFIDDDFGDDDWEDDEDFDSELTGAGLQKEKKSLGLSFNTIVITIAVIVGFCVLGYQVMTQKPQMLEKFTTALNMTGATSGPIFGKEEASDDLPVPSVDNNAGNDAGGFLNEPEILDQDAPPSLDNTPPMPSSIGTPEGMSPEESASLPEPQNDILTPMPAGNSEEGQVPRSPDDMPPAPTYSIDARNDAPEEQPAADAPNKAEDMLKNMMAAREQKKAEEQQAQMQAPPEETPVEPAPSPVPVIETPAPEQATAPAAQAAMSDEAAQAITSKMDTLLERLGGMESRIEEINTQSDQKIAALREEIKQDIASVQQQIKDTPAPAAPPSENTAAPTGVSEEDLQTMRNDMQRAFEKELQDAKAAMQKEVAAIKETATQAAPVKAEPEQKAQTPAPSSAPAPVKKAAAPKPKAQPAPAPAATRTTWVLKAAKPGKAWVSPAGANTIRGVGLGDTLDGIGKITAISFSGGRWIIQGTGGQIRQ